MEVFGVLLWILLPRTYVQRIRSMLCYTVTGKVSSNRGDTTELLHNTARQRVWFNYPRFEYDIWIKTYNMTNVGLLSTKK